MARLVVRSGPEIGQVFVLEGNEITVGRAPENDVVLRSDSVSRQHAVITLNEDGIYFIQDRDSKNGTRLNGVVASEPVALADSTRIHAGDIVLEFQVDTPTVTVAALPGSDASRPGGALVVDAQRAAVTVRGKELELPPKEYAALTLLYSRAGTVVSKEELATHVWPEYEGDVSDYNIHQVVSRLRRAIEVDASRPQLLITRPGFGYRLDLGTAES